MAWLVVAVALMGTGGPVAEPSPPPPPPPLPVHLEHPSTGGFPEKDMTDEVATQLAAASEPAALLAQALQSLPEVVNAPSSVHRLEIPSI